MTVAYPGRCHCGDLGWEFRTATEPARWTVRSCQCGFCRSHAARCTSDPAGTVAFVARSPQGVVRYRFGLETADFLLCRRCGVYIGALMKTPGGAFATLNLNALETPAGEPRDSAPVSYEGETAEDRVARRAARWTPVIAVI